MVCFSVHLLMMFGLLPILIIVTKAAVKFVYISFCGYKFYFFWIYI